MKNRLAALAVLALSASTLGVSAAHATVARTDLDAHTVDAARTDKANDTHFNKRSGVPGPVAKSIDLRASTFHVDRDTETVTATYQVRKVMKRTDVTQIFGTLVSGTGGVASFVTDTVSRSVQVTSTENTTEDHGGQRPCEEASVEFSTRADTVTVTLPLICLGGVEHGRLNAFTRVGTARGADVSADSTSRTRDLPLTVFGTDPSDPTPARRR